MLKTNFKKLIFLILISACVAGVSGCVKKKSPKQMMNSNTNANIITNTNTPVQNGDIDTSDWLTYRNEEYGFEVRYPEGWKAEEKNSSYNNEGVVGIFINLNQLEGFYIFPRGEFDYGLGNKIGSANLIIDERDAIRDIYNNLNLIKFTDKNIHKDFRIELYYRDEKNLEKLNVILSTFKFID